MTIPTRCQEKKINFLLVGDNLVYKRERVPGPEWSVASHLTRVQSSNSYVQGGSMALGPIDQQHPMRKVQMVMYRVISWFA